MKKIEKLLIVLLGVLLLPISVNAEEKEKINIYFFYGDGCTYCASAEEFFAGFDEEYTNMANIKMYETWYDEDNNTLMETVGEKLGESVEGVPYIVIGNKSFNGYSSSMDEEIKTAIKEEYESDQRYTDIELLVNESNANPTDPTNVSEDKDVKKDNSTDIIITVVAVAVIAGFVCLIVFARKSNK